jgi:Protein of unknown function, DUF547
MKYSIVLLSLLFTLKSIAQPTYADWNTFLKKYVSTTGEVNYKSIKANRSELDKITKEFSNTKVLDSWPKDEQLAFWINAYNAFTVSLLVDNYPLKSIQDLDGGKTWDVKRITIDGKKYSLNNIENDIIRPKYKDARIHFAVNCGATSCPPLLNAAFIGKTLNSQLEAVTKTFINNNRFQTLSPSSAKISKIFEWYAKDFGDLVTFINKYSTVQVKKDAKVIYNNYDWSLNGK